MAIFYAILPYPTILYLYPMLKLLKRLFMKPHSITIPIALIHETPNDMELGALIRSMVKI